MPSLFVQFWNANEYSNCILTVANPVAMFGLPGPHRQLPGKQHSPWHCACDMDGAMLLVSVRSFALFPSLIKMDLIGMGAWKKLQPPPIPPHITGKTWVFSKLSHKNDAICQDRACTIIGIQLVWKAASLELQPKPGCRLRALPPVQNSQGSERSKQVICSNSQRSRGTGHKTWHVNPLFRKALSAFWA